MVVGLREFPVDSVEFLKQLIEESGNKRSTGSTAANADSSRSHSIMQFALKLGGPEGRHSRRRLGAAPRACWCSSSASCPLSASRAASVGLRYCSAR